MDNKLLSDQFWAQGYLIIEHFFYDQLMDKLNQIILNHYGMNPDWKHSNEFLKKSKTEVIPWFPFRDGNVDFQVIEDDPNLAKLTSSILGSGWKSLYLMSMFSKKGSMGQAWHQDCLPENKNEFNLNRLIYTHDITDRTGGKTIVMPGTHKGGALSIGDPHEDLDGQVVLMPKKGTLVLIHGHLWHRVLPVTGAYRVSTNSRVIPKNTSEDITDIAVYRNMKYRFSTNEVIEERLKSH